MILQTERLNVRELTLADAPLVLELLNEPDFHRYIGDKGVRDVPGAEQYLSKGPLAMYARHGFGLWLVALKDSGTPIGICGPLKRDAFDHPDLGFALLARFARQGFGYECASAILAHARQGLKLGTLLAITAPENPPSIRLLEKLGFRFEKMINLPGNSEPSRIFRNEP